jgi:uncharacterized Zn finger protein
MAWGYWSRYTYVSKAEKLHKAERAKATLRRKKGAAIEPIEISGREIARTWWGKSWNENLERYSDYDNRLPRGRTYVRSGSVLDLKITSNLITAVVSGSRPQPYRIEIRIKQLNQRNEQALMKKSRSSLDSMQSLLSGEFPSDLKGVFLAEGTGLFPAPSEIEFSCSCPDWASMCKHVAAALYGTAVRLDEKPELFFVLRGVQISSFVGEVVKHETRKLLKTAEARSERVLTGDEEELSRLFGIVMEKKTPGGSPQPSPQSPVAVSKRSLALGRTQQTLEARKRRNATGKRKKKVAGRKVR